MKAKMKALPKTKTKKKKAGLSTQEEKNTISPDKLVLYDKLIKTHPDIERKGVGLPYTSFNGHMFTFLSKSGSLGLRLPTDERQAFLKKYNTTLFEAYGAVMKEYVLVPEKLLKDTQALKKHLDVSYEYVKTLKPKPQKKDKTAHNKE